MAVIEKENVVIIRADKNKKIRYKDGLYSVCYVKKENYRPDDYKEE